MFDQLFFSLYPFPAARVFILHLHPYSVGTHSVFVSLVDTQNIIISHPVSSLVYIYTTLSRGRSALAMVSNFPDCDWLVLLTFPDLCIDISCSLQWISQHRCVRPKTAASKGEYRSCWCGGIGECVSSSLVLHRGITNYSLLGNTAKYMPAVMCDVLCVRGGGDCEWFTTYHSNLVA